MYVHSNSKYFRVNMKPYSTRNHIAKKLPLFTHDYLSDCQFDLRSFNVDADNALRIAHIDHNHNHKHEKKNDISHVERKVIDRHSIVYWVIQVICIDITFLDIFTGSPKSCDEGTFKF